ncbi:glycoside hydrolase family 3 C-terminal domain-containing protein [Nonomuraea sp. NPDC049129]|uniref:glycoside hydrolase family 3 protein n=1 Tax=Nonomuraea sp. NPDC049129 TaxID=3155272 RepID=UPI0033F69EE0
MPRRLHRATALAAAALLTLAGVAQSPPAAGASDPSPLSASYGPEQRAERMLARMTLDEKIAMLHGVGFEFGKGYAGRIPGNTRLGIPAIYLADGPNGVANGSTGITAFPAAINGSATWDTALMRRYGEAVGAEQAGKGHNVALAPTINIVRSPRWGRTFETFSEDPYLTARMATEEVKGVQSQGVIAMPKHFAANNQETDRGKVDVRVSERALNEIYYPGFRAAVRDGGARSVMCAYPKVNGTYACENGDLLRGALKDAMAFTGFVVSDWGATHSTVASADAGLDVEMPGSTYFGDALKQAVAAGQVTVAAIDDKVRRILSAMYRTGLFDRDYTPRDEVSTPAHRELARGLAEQGMVLLKNERGVLPLNKARSLAVIGDAAGDHATFYGGGSAALQPSTTVSPLAGLTARAGGGVTLNQARGTLGTGALPVLSGDLLRPASGDGPGLTATYYPAPDFTGDPVLTRVEPSVSFSTAPSGVTGTWSARWTGTLTPPKTGGYRFSLNGSGQARLYIDGKLVAANHTEFGGIAHGLADLTAGRTVSIKLEYSTAGSLFGAALQLGWAAPDPALPAEAVAAARRSDVALVFVNDAISEGADRDSLALPGDQDQLIEAVAAANPRTVVVLNTGAPSLMPWLNRVAGVLQAWYPGQEYGNAVAAVLFGDVNPSGKLPVTFPADDRQGPDVAYGFPGDGTTVRYDEGLNVGYRWYDARRRRPLFPFGHGLSYTSFAYDNLRADSHAVRVRVTNTGARAGAETAQLYLGFPSAAGEPPQQLKGFQKVWLRPGQSTVVTFPLDSAALSSWSPAAKRWVASHGVFTAAVGASSRDLRVTGQFRG